MDGGYFTKFVLSIALFLGLMGAGLAQEPTQHVGPVSEAGLGRMLASPQNKGPDQSSKVIQEIADFTCANPNTGAPIPVVKDTALQNIAVSRRLPGGALEIYYNPKYMGLFQPPTALFWLQHECMHHQLGHTAPHDGPPLDDAGRAVEENEADCAAIKTMVKRQPPMIDAAQLQTIETEIGKLTGGGFYKTGPERAKWIDGCVVQAVEDIKAGRAN